MIEETGIIKLLKAEVGKGILGAAAPRQRKVLVEIESSTIRKASEVLLKKGSRFVIIAAVDEGLDIELLYHFDLGGTVVVLKTKVKKEAPEVESVADLTPAAEWAEREAAELFGVNFKAHPRPGHLLLPDDWPAENHPLGKPFKSKLPEQLCPVAESITSVGATAPISPLVQRRREEAGLPPQPPASYSSDRELREVHELVKQTKFDERAGYDWARKKLRGTRK